MSVTVRYFAAARAIAGATEERLPPATLGDVITAISDGHGPEMAKVAGSCSFLVDGVATTDHERLVADGSTVDVLPPFAGG